MIMKAVRKSLRIGSIASLLLLASAYLPAQKLQSFSYPADGFRASFPAEPQLEKKSQPAKSGSIDLHSYCSQSGDDHYCIVVIENGVEATGLVPEMMVELVKQGVLTSPNTHKVSDSPISVDGHPGVTVEAQSDTTHYSSRIFAVGETIYQLLVESPVPADKTIRPLDPSRFYNSFKLINRKTD
jgi:hypothetical protein